MRKGESEQVIDVFKNQMDANLVYVDATDRFLGKLVDIADPEAKRKIIGDEFIRVFEEEARKVGNEVSFLAQGTIYPDILESKDGVKAHHNVGGLPDDLQFELCEPVKLLYKDEVRVVGREEIDEAGLTIWQYFAVVPDFRATGVRDGKRAYDWPCIIRCINTVDVMTAEVPELDWALLKRITARITAEVPGICRVCYDLTPKPVGTVEWEQADRVLTCTFEYCTVPLSFVSYESHGKATSDNGE
jgi:GMP synthase (glutamine-hydrolysing)